MNDESSPTLAFHHLPSKGRGVCGTWTPFRPRRMKRSLITSQALGSALEWGLWGPAFFSFSGPRMGRTNGNTSLKPGMSLTFHTFPMISTQGPPKMDDFPYFSMVFVGATS